MSGDAPLVRFLYNTGVGRMILQAILHTHIDALAVWFLRSRWSRPAIKRYAKEHNIPLTREELAGFSTFQDFFARTRESVPFDPAPEHLISPCDGWLSAYPIQPDSAFVIKGSRYRLCDLLHDRDLSGQFYGGDCLVFRLTPSDYHHYCYIDDGYHWENHDIPGQLHSVQPIACGTYPVYTLNRRSWTLLSTDHFGPVVQIEIGALIVGGICNEKSCARFDRGSEMGHFELAGSTIVLLFQKGQVCLLPHIYNTLASGEEFRVTQGMWIGNCPLRRENAI